MKALRIHHSDGQRNAPGPHTGTWGRFPTCPRGDGQVGNLPHANRRGALLLVVLVVVAMLALGAYTFTELMLSEAEATAAFGRGVEARAFAQSGIETAAAYLGTRTTYGGDNFYHDPTLFQGVLMRDAPTPRGRGRFSLVAPVETDPSAQLVRYGLSDESGKLNLNALLQSGMSDDEMTTALIWLPGMTVETADAILDWIDADEEPRLTGAESDYYQTLAPPYFAKNGPLESLDELLLVQGVTPGLLFGEDANRNGLLDANENDGDESPPFDNADGVLDPGWSALLTVFSREANRRLDGTPRINLNHSLLTELYDQLEPEFGEEVAQFVVAYRMNGPKQSDEEGDEGDGGQGSSGSSQDRDRGDDGGRSGGGSSSGDQRGSGSSSGSGGGSSAPPANGGSGSPSGGSRSRPDSSGSQGDRPSGDRGGNPSRGGGGSSSGGGSVLEQATQSLARGLFGGGDGDVTRGGMDLSRGGRNQINSLYDLIGAVVEVEIDGQEEELSSPWPADSSMADYLPDLMNRLSTIDAEFRTGRINLNTARREVLLGIPGLTEELVDAILAARGSGDPAAAIPPERATTGWLVSEGLVDLTQMRQLDRYLTTQGDVYHVQSVGYFEAGGPVVRLEAMIDATKIPPRVVFQRDLTHLGRGYAIQHLLPPTIGTAQTAGR